jgi:uncharacterized membrane-anchored protein
MTVLVSILTLVPWVLVAGLIFFLIQIAHFYQRKYAELYKSSAGQRTYYAVFLVPLLLFVVAAVRYAYLSDFAGDWIGDIALLIGGALLAALAYRLQRMMTGGRE